MDIKSHLHLQYKEQALTLVRLQQILLSQYQQAKEAPLFYAVVLLVVACVTTRILSGINGRSRVLEKKGVQTVPGVSYWFPIIGHAFSYVFMPTLVMENIRNLGWPIWRLKINRTTHYITQSPVISTALFSMRPTQATADPLAWFLLQEFFGCGPGLNSVREKFILKDLHQYATQFSRDTFLEPSVPKVAKCIAKAMPDFVTYSYSPVDMTPWERTADCVLVSAKTGEAIDPRRGGGSPAISASDIAVEASLFPLIRNFFAHTVSPILMGSAFIDANPHIFEALWAFDAARPLFLAKLPSWTPLPTFQRGRIARNELLCAIEELQTALTREEAGEDPGVPYGDLSDVSDTVRDRTRLCRKEGVSATITAASDLSLLWAFNVNAAPLTFWFIYSLISRPELLAAVRAEIAPYVKIVRPDSGLPIAPRPRVELVSQDLSDSTKCPLFKATYYESLRLHTTTTSMRKLMQDVVVPSSEKNDTNNTLPYVLNKGSIVHVSSRLFHTSDVLFNDPKTFAPQRFLAADGRSIRADEVGKLRSFGGGYGVCKGRVLAEKTILAITAGVISLWDITPAGPPSSSPHWIDPGSAKGSARDLPGRDVRVRISRRPDMF